MAVQTSAVLAEIQPSGTDAPPMEQVRVNGTLLPVDRDFLFQGTLSGEYSRECDRCLAMAIVPFNQKVSWLFKENADGVFREASETGEDDEKTERRSFHGPVVNLGPCVWEEVVLNAPHKFVCGPDCRGLCPRCGVNLNEEPCRCDKMKQEEPVPVNGLAALAGLFPDLSRNDPKE